MTLSEAQKKFLRGMGHRLKPIITIGGAGLSESVVREFDSSIAHHELIKVRVRVGDRNTRDAIISKLCDDNAAELVARVGNVALIYRKNEDAPKIPLPIA